MTEQVQDWRNWGTIDAGGQFMTKQQQQAKRDKQEVTA